MEVVKVDLLDCFGGVRERGQSVMISKFFA